MKSKATALLVIVSLLATTAPAFAAPPEHSAATQLNPAIERANRPVGQIPHRDWHRGDRLPPEYRDHIFVVGNLHQHGLQTPPRGYHWVGVAGDYVLVATATGLIEKIQPAGTH